MAEVTARDLALERARGMRPVPVRAGVRAPEIVERLRVRAAEPWVSLTLGGDELLRLPLRGTAVLIGGPGSCKTSLVAGVLVEHAREVGPAIVVSRELDAEELFARIVGMQCDAAWEDVLRGRVSESEVARVLALPRLEVLEGEHATFGDLVRAVEQMRVEFPDEPIVTAVDYLQIMPSDAREERARVTETAEAFRALTKRERVVGIGISQTSRAGHKALRAGEMSGADTMSAGADSSAIERGAYTTLAIGPMGPVREDGTCSVEVHQGKGRMGGGDRVIPLSLDPRTGRARIAGEPRAAAEVRAEREAETNASKVEAACLAMAKAAEKATAPMTRTELRKAAGARGTAGDAAIAHLLAAGELVEVRVRRPRQSAWTLWTPDRARAAGVAAVEREP